MRRLAALFLSAAALTPKAPTPAPPPTLTSEAYRVASAFDKKLSVWYASYYYGLGTAYRRTGEAFLGRRFVAAEPPCHDCGHRLS